MLCFPTFRRAFTTVYKSKLFFFGAQHKHQTLKLHPCATVLPQKEGRNHPNFRSFVLLLFFAQNMCVCVPTHTVQQGASQKAFLCSCHSNTIFQVTTWRSEPGTPPRETASEKLPIFHLALANPLKLYNSLWTFFFFEEVKGGARGERWRRRRRKEHSC